MPKKGSKLDDLLAQKSPTTLRNVPIQKVSIIEEAERLRRTEEQEKKPVESSLPEDRPAQAMVSNDVVIPSVEAPAIVEQESSEQNPNGVSTHKDVEKRRNIKSHTKTVRNERTKKPRVYSGRDIEALLALNKRQSERYSFEIYSDQKEDIQRVCELYEEKTGQHLSASRLIREVLDSFLPGALKTFGDE